jgi:hypothetical protein
MAVEVVTLGFEPKGRETIRRRKNAGSLPGDSLMPHPPPSRSVGLWIFNPQPNTTMAKLEAAYLGALEAVDQAEARRSEARASGKFTDEGINADVLGFAASALAPELLRHRRTVEAARQEAHERRRNLTIPIEKDAYAFALRQKKLELLLQLPPAQRQKAFEREVDPELAQAVVELNLPPDAVGISGSAQKLARDALMRAAHGSVLDELDQLDSAVALADRAVRMAREELVIEADVDPAKFDAAAAPFEKGTGPWLKKVRQGNEEVVRVVRWNANGNGGTLATPTPDELEQGVFYRDFDEYRAAHA